MIITYFTRKLQHHYLTKTKKDLYETEHCYNPTIYSAVDHRH